MGSHAHGKRKSPKDPHGLRFPGWAEALAAETSLSPGLRESYQLTLMDFRLFCHKRGASTSLDLAREFVDLLQLERKPHAMKKPGLGVRSPLDN